MRKWGSSFYPRAVALLSALLLACGPAVHAASTELAATYGLTAFKDPQHKSHVRPPLKVPVFTIVEVARNAVGESVYRCNRIGKIPTGALNAAFDHAVIAGIYRGCQLVKLDFGNGNAFWIHFDWLKSDKPSAWGAFMTRGSKEIYCFSDKGAYAADAPGGSRAESRYFC